MSQIEEKRSKRNDQIESLRGCAMLIILVFHYFFRYNQIYHDLNNGIEKYIPAFGVFIFCLISGVYIDHANIPQGTMALRSRLLKIWVPYVISITITFIVTRIFPLPGRTVTFKEYLLNIPCLNGFIGKPYVDEAHWYITTLIACWVWFAFFTSKITFERRPIIYIIWLTIVTCLFLVRQNMSGSKILTFIITLLGGEYSAAILCGVFLGRASHHKREFVFCIVSAISIMLMQGLIKGMILFFCSIIVFVAMIKGLPLLKRSFLAKFGVISYFVYLLHQNLGYILIQRMESYSIDPVIGATLAVPFFLFVGWLFYCIIHPITNMINKIC